MLLDGKDVSQLVASDLQELIDQGELESKTLEYKQQLPEKTSDEQKFKFLKSVCSMANSAGGFIIYGIEAKDGKPINVVGLPGQPGSDKEILRIEQIIRSGTSPSIQGITPKCILLHVGGWVLVLKIPHSYISPHAVVYGSGCPTFFIRSNNGNNPMDVDEIRRAFLLSETISDKIRAFQRERVRAIVAADHEKGFSEPRLILHIIPLSSFYTSQYINLPAIYTNNRWNTLVSEYWTHCYNLEGLLAYRSASDANYVICEYLQLYRNGVIEVVDSHSIGTNTQKTFFYEPFEDLIVKRIWQSINMYGTSDIDAPLLVFIYLYNVNGLKLPLTFFINNLKPIDRDILQVPELWIGEYPSNIDLLVDNIKGIFDILWNAFGVSEWSTYEKCKKRVLRYK